MSKKRKFRPKITQVKLNPEQAVLSCGCYQGNIGANFEWGSGSLPILCNPMVGRDWEYTFNGSTCETNTQKSYINPTPTQASS